MYRGPGTFLVHNPVSILFPVSKQLQNVILKLVRESFGDMYYPKALDCLAALRQQGIKVGSSTALHPTLLHSVDSEWGHTWLED